MNILLINKNCQKTIKRDLLELNLKLRQVSLDNLDQKMNLNYLKLSLAL